MNEYDTKAATKVIRLLRELYPEPTRGLLTMLNTVMKLVAIMVMVGESEGEDELKATIDKVILKAQEEAKK